MCLYETPTKGIIVNIKNLKDKAVRNLPAILGVTVAVTAVTAAVVVAKTSKNVNVPTSLRDGIDGTIDPNFLHDMIGEAKKTSLTFVSDKEAIIYLSK